MDCADLIRQLYAKEKSPSDNTVNIQQMQRILDGLGIGYHLRKKSKNTSHESLIYLKYKDTPNEVKHWVVQYQEEIYDSLSLTSPVDVESFFNSNPAYTFSASLNIHV